MEGGQTDSVSEIDQRRKFFDIPIQGEIERIQGKEEFVCQHSLRLFGYLSAQQVMFGVGSQHPDRIAYRPRRNLD
jgi:hypothetical protein